MYVHHRVPTAVIFVAMAGSLCFGQSVISAHSGTIHYFEGDVSINGKPVESKTGKFAQIKEQEVLRTAQGRAEILLTPGVFLRVGENSAIRMLDTRLVSTRVDFLSGNIVVESDDPQMSLKNSPVSLLYKDAEIRLIKHGLIEISSDPAEMKVYKGEAEVVAEADRHVVHDGQMLPLTGTMTAEKFDDKTADDLYLWARDRSQDLSAANMSSAQALNAGGYGLSNGSGWSSGWYFNPYLDMFTFVPGTGTFWNPWGYGFFSPLTISDFYVPGGGYYWYGGGTRTGRPIALPAPSGRTAAPLSSLQRGSTPPGFGSTIRGGAIATGPRTSPVSRGAISPGIAAPRPSGGGGAVHSAGGARGR